MTHTISLQVYKCTKYFDICIFLCICIRNEDIAIRHSGITYPNVIKTHRSPMTPARFLDTGDHLVPLKSHVRQTPTYKTVECGRNHFTNETHRAGTFSSEPAASTNPVKGAQRTRANRR